MSPDTRIAAVCTALAHPRRVRMFRILLDQPEAGDCLLTLMRAARIPPAPFRHHLQVMERAGVVRRRRKGSKVRLALALRGLSEAMVSVDGMVRGAAPRRARSAVRAAPAAALH